MRIGIVNGVAVVASFLQRVVSIDPANRVIWTALSGTEALAFCAKETPDLILLDMMTPAMGGVETTRRIMATTPCAILIVTGSIQANANRVFAAMGHGALDAVDTPAVGSGLVEGVTGPILAKIALIGRLIGDRIGREAIAETASPSSGRNRLIAIGSSAGGPAVLATILGDLPATFPAAVVIVQHVDEEFAEGMADWLNQTTPLPVRVAKEGDRPRIGEVLLASTRDHLTLKAPDRVGYTAEPVDYAYRPSVDVFFHSVCRLWRGEVVGVLLTGMGSDGAIGLKALRDQGHYTIAQDQATSAVYGMPKAAAQIGAAIDVLPAGRIGAKLNEVGALISDRISRAES